MGVSVSCFVSGCLLHQPLLASMCIYVCVLYCWVLVCLCVCPSVRPSVCLSVRPSVCLSSYLSVWLPSRVFICSCPWVGIAGRILLWAQWTFASTHGARAQHQGFAP